MRQIGALCHPESDASFSYVPQGPCLPHLSPEPNEAKCKQILSYDTHWSPLTLLLRPLRKEKIQTRLWFKAELFPDIVPQV